MSTSPTTVSEFVATMTKEEMLAEILARLEEMNAQLHCLVEPSTSSRHPPTSAPIVDVGIEDREHEVTTLVAASSSRAATPSSVPLAPSSNPTALQEAILPVDIATPKYQQAVRTNCSTLGRNTGDPILAAQDTSLVDPVADPDDSTGVSEVSTEGKFCILFDADADGGGVDHLSRLPDSLLRDIVSRLPIKDAVRTAVLSRRWSPIKRAAPLLIYDADASKAVLGTNPTTNSLVTVASASPAPSPTSTHSQGVALDFQFGSTKLLIASPTRCSTLHLYRYACVPMMLDTPTQYIIHSHTAMVARYCCLFGFHIQSFRSLPWPPWVFARVFSTWVLLISSLSLLHPPDTSSSSCTPCIDSSCALTFDPGITLLYIGKVMSTTSEDQAMAAFLLKKEQFRGILALPKSREEFLITIELGTVITSKCSTLSFYHAAYIPVPVITCTKCSTFCPDSKKSTRQGAVALLLMKVQARCLSPYLGIELLSMGSASLPQAYAMPIAPHDFVNNHSAISESLLFYTRSCGLLHTLSHGEGEASSGLLVLFTSKYEEKDIGVPDQKGMHSVSLMHGYLFLCEWDGSERSVRAPLLLKSPWPPPTQDDGRSSGIDNWSVHWLLFEGSNGTGLLVPQPWPTLNCSQYIEFMQLKIPWPSQPPEKYRGAPLFHWTCVSKLCIQEQKQTGEYLEVFPLHEVVSTFHFLVSLDATLVTRGSGLWKLDIVQPKATSSVWDVIYFGFTELSFSKLVVARGIIFLDQITSSWGFGWDQIADLCAYSDDQKLEKCFDYLPNICAITRKAAVHNKKTWHSILHATVKVNLAEIWRLAIQSSSEHFEVVRCNKFSLKKGFSVQWDPGGFEALHCYNLIGLWTNDIRMTNNNTCPSLLMDLNISITWEIGQWCRLLCSSPRMNKRLMVLQLFVLSGTSCSMLVVSASQSPVPWDPGIYEVLQISTITTHGLGASRVSRREVCQEPMGYGLIQLLGWRSKWAPALDSPWPMKEATGDNTIQIQKQVKQGNCRRTRPTNRRRRALLESRRAIARG